MKLDIGDYKKFVEKIHIWLKLDRNVRHITWKT